MSSKKTYRITGRPYDVRRALDRLSKKRPDLQPRESTTESFLVRATPEEAQEIRELLKGFAPLRIQDVGVEAGKFVAWARARLEEKRGDGSKKPRVEQKPPARHVVVLKQSEDDGFAFVQPARDIQIAAAS